MIRIRVKPFIRTREGSWKQLGIVYYDVPEEWVRDSKMPRTNGEISLGRTPTMRLSLIEHAGIEFEIYTEDLDASIRATHDPK